MVQGGDCPTVFSVGATSPLLNQANLRELQRHGLHTHPGGHRLFHPHLWSKASTFLSPWLGLRDNFGHWDREFAHPRDCLRSLCCRSEQISHGGDTAQELSITRACGISTCQSEDMIATEAPVTTCKRMGPPILSERADPIRDL